MKRALWMAFLLGSSALAAAQQRQPAQMTTLPTTSPQEYDLLDKTGAWVNFGAFLNQNFDPRTYGAKCDGATDDTAALQAWAGAIRTNSRVYIPSGFCNFSAPLAFANVNNVTIDGGAYPGTLQYVGAATTGNIVTIGGPPPTCAAGGDGWTINGLRLMSTTKMTTGTGLVLQNMCELNVSNITVGGDIGGNQNWWNAVWFNGGNSIYMRGYNFSGSGTGEVASSANTSQRLVGLYQTQGKIYHSGLGLNIAGGVGALTLEQTDIGANGENVRLSQDAQAYSNIGQYFGAGVFIDLTDLVKYPAASGIGLHITDPGSDFSDLFMSGTWISGANNGCVVIEPGVTARVHWVGGASHFCGAAAAGQGAITNRTIGASIDIVGVRFYEQGGCSPVSCLAGPYIYNIPGGKPISLSGVQFNTNANGYVVGPSMGGYSIMDTGQVVLQSTGAQTAMIGAGTTAAQCGLWVQSGVTVPGNMDGSAGACAHNMGTVAHPFGSVASNNYVASGVSGITKNVVAGNCTFTITNGIITGSTGTGC